jgi:ethanolamine ammonia-lyase large subunit
VTVYRQSLGGHTYQFDGVVDLLARATPQRSGDQLAGCAATSDAERAAAQWALAEVELATLLEHPVVPYDTDDVTRLILDRHDAAAFAPLAAWTVGEFRDRLLAIATSPTAAVELTALAPGLTPEMVAAVSKLMRNADLMTVAKAARVSTAFRSTIGVPGRLATRLQPNHPTDDARGVAAAVLDGLLLGSGDAVIGINPATDSPATVAELLHLLDDIRARFEIPTQTCVLTHVTTTLDLIGRAAPVDLVFQSIAGTQGGNESFGVELGMLADARAAALELGRGTVGDNVMYFETGQGSALSAGAHLGTDGKPVDQQTLEVRAYGLAREFAPLLVNTVVGFIGPEYLYDGKQIVRAGLEDYCCGKLLGLPMGVDVCYTNHAEADQDDMDNLLVLLAAAGVGFVIAVPGADDVMLGYQSLSFHDVLAARAMLGLRPAPEFETWLAAVGLGDERGGVRSVDPAGSALRQVLGAR